MEIPDDQYFMKQAMVEAEKAFEDGEIPVGAVIVCGRRIIARAHNQVERLNDVTAHAEMLSITAAQNHLNAKYLNECRMFVTLEPCAMCAGALYWSQIGELVFGAPDQARGYRKYDHNLIHPKTTLKQGMMAGESTLLIQSFFKRLRGNNS